MLIIIKPKKSFIKLFLRGVSLRKIRGVEKLVDYLSSINCPISKATIYRLMKTKSIPVIRPAPRVIIFDLDQIDKWLNGEH